jgi:peptidoglycan/LPS O-acetylase OafA/YrhL
MNALKTYRRDIDGLRAIAVLPVVLFHSGVPGFSGGFVGVDVFFVISGFVITSLLQGDVRAGRFSILRFYNRRIRRIFPALFLLLAVVTAAALAWLTPLDLKRYGQSLASTAVFASNIFFFLKSGYFDTASIEKPLLHTWSLAVEEQFYIVWPIALWAMHKLRGGRWLLSLTLLGLAVSFGLCVWQTGQNATAAFYLPHTRFWELLLGAVLAMRPLTFKPRWLKEALAALGLGLIAFAVVTFNDNTAFPGFAAAAPCVGTFLLVAANQDGDTAVARLLSLRPLVFIGLVSYSFYLWHWPVLVFARYVAPTPPSVWVLLTLMAGAFVMAVISWRFVERPFRQGAALSGAQARSLIGGGLAIALALAVALPMHFTDGLPGRVPPGVVVAERASLDRGPGSADCGPPGTARAGPGCRLGAPGKRYSVILWGDSHADAFAPAVDAAAKAAGVSGWRVTRSACAPLIGAWRAGRGEEGRAACPAFNAAALKMIADSDVDTVVLDARWPLLAEASRYGDEEGSKPWLADARDQTQSLANNRRVLKEGLRRTIAEIRRLKGPKVRIVLVGPVPELGFDAPRCLALARMFHRSEVRCRAIPQANFERRSAYSADLLRAVAAEDPNTTIFWPSAATCVAGRCVTEKDGVILYRDDDHLTAPGARLIGARLSLR